jgi:UDP-N-acetylglucosamine--N-acetylmuramyl-(pentapeptide) pyrophosphoryl-undecaprenol N-acetylglucosamine transferase
MRVLIAAGGTGGHIYPGIAVANEIVKRYPSAEVLFVGTAKGLESQIVPENGYQLMLISSSGLKNVGLIGKLKGISVLPRSFVEAKRIIWDFQPEIVVGAGGYVSGPVLLTARFLRIPTMIMDSNALPGFTNRRLAPFVDRAALTFEEARVFFGKKGVVTGNPVRQEFFSVPAKKATIPLQVLIFGGSQGARAINNAVVASLPYLQDTKGDLHIVHQTGNADFQAVEAQYSQAGWTEVDVRPYITDMVSSFASSDLLITRAGATTCAEVAAAGRASIMIPLPTAADDHQRKNAEAMVREGAARMILQSELTGERLAAELQHFIDAPADAEAIGSAARKLARPDAASATVDLIEELVTRGKSNV